MNKWLLFILTCALFLVGCGEKSTITNNVKAEKLACVYGDCKHIIQNVTFPLDDSALAFKTPLPGLGPIAGGIVKFVGDIFAKRTKMGKLQLSYTQPLPPIPEELHSVRLKRFFFYMRPVKQRKLTFRETVDDWFNRYVLGRGHTTFAFLDKMAVRLSSSTLSDSGNYLPAIKNEFAEDTTMKELMRVFTDAYRRQVIDPEVAQDIILLKYHKKFREKDTSNKLYGTIHYIETTGEAAKLKKFLLKQEVFRGHFKKILLLEKSLLVELENDPVSDEIFKNLMIDKADEMDKLGVTFIDTCTQSSCLEVNVPNVNLIPIATKGNALKLDAIIHADDVPESFKLKGFVEFEARIESVI